MPNDRQKKHRSQEPQEDEEPSPGDLGSALEQLDRAAARVRQLIYRVRPMLRDDGADEGEAAHEERRPVRGQFRRQRR